MTETWRYVLRPRALRDMEALDRQVRQRVFEALDTLVENPFRGQARKLRGRAGEWKLRVGDWRVRFRLDYSARLIVVLRVRVRERAYRR